MVSHDFFEMNYRMLAANGGAKWFHDFVGVTREQGIPRTIRGCMIEIDEIMQELEARKEMLAFERALSELAATFVNVPPDLVDSRVESGLQALAEVLGTDRANLGQKDPLTGNLIVTHSWARSGYPTTPRGMAKETFAWTADLIEKGGTVSYRSPEELPAEAIAEREYLLSVGVKSTLVVPLHSAGELIGAMATESFQTLRDWDPGTISRFVLAGTIFCNALARKRANEELQKAYSQVKELKRDLEQRLGFEELLSELSTRFVNLPSDQVDGEIEEAQRRVCECLGLDLSVLWQWSIETPRILTLTHFYRPLGGPPPPEPMYAHEHFPWCQQELEAGRTIAISSLEEFPAEATRDREAQRQFGVKSTLTFPLSPGGGSPIGALSFNTMQAERTWPEAIIQRLRLVAQMFTNALIRKQAETTLRESETRLSLTTEAVGAGLWILEVDTDRVWVSPKSRELFQFAPDEEICYESFFRVIHPEDRDRVHEEVQGALQSGENLLTDYRIVLRDGSIRWVVTRGQRFRRSNRDPERMMGLSLDITERKQMEEQLKEHLHEIEALKERLERENIYLRKEVKGEFLLSKVTGQSGAIREVLTKARQVADTDSVVLIIGETGTGKELIATIIHQWSRRKDRTMIKINCAALPATLIESELFGREKGAYTGALSREIGRFELADKSTILLDEIGELPMELQAKLLRVLQEGEFERLGSSKTLRVDSRVIAATSRDLSAMVKEGKFREDLFYRLNVFPIRVPPLRERWEDIPALMWDIIRELGTRMGRNVESIRASTLKDFQEYSWPGNVRELRNIIERYLILKPGPVFQAEVPRLDESSAQAGNTLEQIDSVHILQVLKATHWRVRGKGGAAEILGLKPTTLEARMKKLKIHRPH